MTNLLTQQVGMPEPTSFAAVGWLLLTLAALGVAVNQVFRLMDRFKDKPAPAEVQRESADKFVTKAQCENYHRSLESKLTFLDGQRVTDAKDQAAGRSRIYDEMKALSKTTMDEISRVRVDMGEMERRLNKADEDRTTHVHDRLNEILVEVGEIRGALKEKG